jgi:PST family polysaccharide transporter
MNAPAAANVRSSVRLSFLATILNGFLQFTAMTILARLLTPAQYGAYALCVAIASLSAVFITNVVERFLVVSVAAEGSRDQTLFIALLVLIASMIVVLVCLGLHLAGIAHIDLGVLALMCLAAVIGSTAIVPRVSLRRQLRFGPIVVAETAGLIAGSGLAAIGFAAAGWGAYALALGACVQNCVIAMLLRIRFPSPGHVIRSFWREGAELVRSAAALGGTAAVEIVNGQIPPLVLGVGLGNTALGLFNRSYSLVQMPIQLLVASMSRVMISALFAVSGDPARLRGTARSLVRVAAVMVTPVAAGIAGASHNFVLLAFGRKWLAAEAILPLLALGAWAVMMGTVLGIIVEAMRAFSAKARAQAISAVFLALLAAGGTAIGLIGSVAGIALSGCIFLFLFARLAARKLGVGLPTIIGWVLPGIVVGLPCLGISLALALFASGPSAFVFAAQIAGCGVVTSAGLILLYPDIALQIAEGFAPGALRFLPPLARHLRRGAKTRAA